MKKLKKSGNLYVTVTCMTRDGEIVEKEVIKGKFPSRRLWKGSVCVGWEGGVGGKGLLL